MRPHGSRDISCSLACHGAAQRLVQESFEEAGSGGGGGGEAGFQLIAERHQGIDLGHDAVLFGEGREWEGVVAKEPERNKRLQSSSSQAFHFSRSMHQEIPEIIRARETSIKILEERDILYAELTVTIDEHRVSDAPIIASRMSSRSTLDRSEIWK